MSAKKSAPKSAAKKRVVGRPLTADDPRRGRGPAPGAPNAGRPPDAFKAMMRELSSSEASVARLKGILEMGSDDLFLKAHAHVTDRGYGRAQQHVDVTTGGASIAEILRKGRDRVARMKAEADARALCVLPEVSP